MKNDNLVKIFFGWTDSDGQEISESVWAEGISIDTFRIDNLPFYAYGISYNDIVSAKIVDNIFVVDELISHGGHSTFRVFFTEIGNSDQELLFKNLNKLGATIERATAQLIAIDVPPNANLQLITELLKDGENRGVWNYEEGFVYKAIERPPELERTSIESLS
jgi:hypothetical protein